MTYTLAERFKSIQGEGLYAGTQMAFLRFVGCSVGKRICQHCDTDFERPLTWRGGGTYTIDQLLEYCAGQRHVCLTGGEPLDQDLVPLMSALTAAGIQVHLETSGTIKIPLMLLYVCVSPKPGFNEDVVMQADEIKVIVPGLGSINTNDVTHWVKLPDNWKKFDETGGELKYWPDLDDALRWAKLGKLVYLQPRNGKFDVDQVNLRLCQSLVAQYPQLRLSVQMHKVLRVE